MEREENVFFTPDGANLEYTVSGSGRKLLFLPDCEQKEAEMTSLAEILEKQYQLYRLSRRGWGNSAPRGGAYSVQQDCRDVRAFMEAMDLDCIFALGYGGLLAIHLAAQIPCDRIVLYEPYLPEQRSFPWLPRMKQEVEEKDYTQAVVTYMKGMFPALRWMPRFALHQLIKKSFVTHDRDKEMMNQIVASADPEQDQRRREDIVPGSWKQATRMLEGIVMESEAARQSEAPDLTECGTEFLLLRTDEARPFVDASVEQLLKGMAHGRQARLDFTVPEQAFAAFDQAMEALMAEEEQDHV